MQEALGHVRQNLYSTLSIETLKQVFWEQSARDPGRDWGYNVDIDGLGCLVHAIHNSTGILSIFGNS